MFDPAALGTLIIGLESASREQQLGRLTDVQRQRRSRGVTRTARVQLATGLRRLAEALEPGRKTAPETAR